MQINLEVNDLDSQFSDGVYLCLLSGLLEGYFVPLYDFHLTPQVNICFLIRVATSLVQIRRDTVLSLVEIPTYHSVYMAISEREWFTLFQISAQILGFIANRVLCFCEYLIHFSLLVL